MVGWVWWLVYAGGEVGSSSWLIPQAGVWFLLDVKKIEKDSGTNRHVTIPTAVIDLR